MYGGFSGAKGFMLYDTSKKETNAVYGFYENNQIVIKTGKLEDLKKQKDQDDEPYKRKDGLTTKIIIGFFLMMLTLVVLSFFLGSFLFFLSTLVFCIGSYFSFMIIILAWINTYDDEETFKQFRRYHATEHASIKLLGSRNEISIEHLKEQSFYESECGTAYAGYWIVLMLVLAILIFNIMNIGILKLIIYLCLTIILLFINVFNPYNPFKLLQYNVVQKPTDKEYALAMEIIKVLEAL